MQAGKKRCIAAAAALAALALAFCVWKASVHHQAARPITLQIVTQEEMGQYPDLVQYLEESGGLEQLEVCNQEAVERAYQEAAERISADPNLQPITPEGVKGLAEKYGLEESTQANAEMQTQLFVVRDDETGAILEVQLVPAGTGIIGGSEGVTVLD